LKTAGTRLLIRRGPSSTALLDLARETGARAVFWNRRYEPAILKRDESVADDLRAEGFEIGVFDAGLLTDPILVRNKSGKPFQVFTPFWKSCLATLSPPTPLPAPRTLMPPSRKIASLQMSDLELEPRINWAAGIAAAWRPGEAGARGALKKFCATDLSNYRFNRDQPDTAGTSRLSPYLHFGEISSRQIWHGLRCRHGARGTGADSWKASQFVTELGWREFAYHLLCHFPDTPTRPLRPEFEQFPWRRSPKLLRAWQRGRTGYPMVDAGMRELWTTGWMHNRVRMIVASFLVKDLLIPWQEGARWFWDTLVDADLANNTLGWQWTAGCGAEAAPFFRIFNPISQGEKFDPAGDYVMRWVPELRGLTPEWIHKPWRAPAELLRQAGVELGRNYPMPVVDHAAARSQALAAFEKLQAILG
jgi:deoxyribodipyrimidine photo-lyase